jgi:hypothetical protein
MCKPHLLYVAGPYSTSSCHSRLARRITLAESGLADITALISDRVNELDKSFWRQMVSHHDLNMDHLVHLTRSKIGAVDYTIDYTLGLPDRFPSVLPSELCSLCSLCTYIAGECSSSKTGPVLDISGFNVIFTTTPTHE